MPLCVFQSRAPADLYLMTKNPEDSPNVQDVLEIEFKKGLNSISFSAPPLYLPIFRTPLFVKPMISESFKLKKDTCIVYNNRQLSKETVLNGIFGCFVTTTRWQNT